MELENYESDVPRQPAARRGIREDTQEILDALDESERTGVNKSVLCSTEEEAQHMVSKFRSIASRFKKSVSAGYFVDPNGGYRAVFGARKPREEAPADTSGVEGSGVDAAPKKRSRKSKSEATADNPFEAPAE